MTAAEFLSAHAAHADVAGFDRENTAALYIANGVPASAVPESTRKVNGYRRGVPEVPRRYRRMMHGDRLRIGDDDWEVITVFGHAPEHAALWCPRRNVLISGDQVLPRITTNVAVWGSQPESNPLKLFLDSMARFAHVAADALVLPSHDRVFRGVHARIAQLHEHHAQRLERLLDGCAQPLSAFDALPLLFRRKLDDHQLMFAMGEAVAHLHYLEQAGRLRRVEEGGLRRFVKVESGA
jgi:glyoxylase-like metal-dependent hydrolase (beta-lactamase superfamily II)